MAIANQLRSLSLLTLLSSSLLLAACGGGGSGGGNTSSSKSVSSTPASSSSVSSASSSSEAPTFTLGGSLEGLAGTGLQLANGEESLSLSSNGNFAFTAALHQGDSYTVTVAQQPSAPNQTCALTNASGANVTANISNVQVSCTTNTYTVGVSVSGLTATGLVLQNNAGDDLTVNADGNFVFATALADQSAFSVSVKTQPTDQYCEASNTVGTLAGANVTNIQFTCISKPAEKPVVALGYGIKTFKFSWAAVDGASYYKLFEHADGSSGYTQVGGEITATNYDHEVSLVTHVGAQYTVEACNPAGCTTSDVVNVSEHLEEAIGFISASNASGGDYFGTAVALSADGTTLVVGAGYEDSANTDPENNDALGAGAVYVFVKTATGWQQQAYLKAPHPDEDDLFGARLALSADGSLLVVSAYDEGSSATGINGDDTDNSLWQAGAVYTYTRNQGVWSFQSYIKASNTKASQEFGWALSLAADGKTLAVGARNESSAAQGVAADQTDNSALNAGAVYVFAQTELGWQQQVYIKASNAERSDYFGSSVALTADGQLLVVGASGEDSGLINDLQDNSANSAGAVYVFDKGNNGWQETAYLKASQPGVADVFGWQVAVSADGSRIAVGALYEDGSATGVNGDELDNASEDSGAVYVFDLGELGWVQSAYIKASNTGANDNFGTALALSADGSTLVVGAVSEDSNATGINADGQDNSIGDSGAAYVFTWANQAWQQTAFLKAPVAESYFLGLDALAISADASLIAVGGPNGAGNPDGVGTLPSGELLPYTGAVFLY